MVRSTWHLDEDALRRILRRRREVMAAYLYGSWAAGRPHRESDVDVAVLLRQRRGVAVPIPPTYEVDLAGEIGVALRHHLVEVVLLNHASPLLAWQVIRHGRRLFARPSRTVAQHERRIRQRYLDTEHLRAIQDRYLDRIIRKGFSRAVGR